MFVVELAQGVYIAEWDGDPGRTLKIENAQEFESLKKAKIALIKARRYRPFLYAKIISNFKK